MFRKTFDSETMKNGKYLLGAAALIGVIGFLYKKGIKGYFKITKDGIEPTAGATATADEAKATNGGRVAPRALGAGPAHASARGATADGRDSLVAPEAVDSNAEESKIAAFSGAGRSNSRRS